MVQTIKQVWRDYNTDGVPSSGDHEPEKREIRALLTAMVGGAAVAGDYQGEWNAGVTYIKGDYVQYDGDLWYALRENINVVPSEGADWTLLLPGATVTNSSTLAARNGVAITLTPGVASPEAEVVAATILYATPASSNVVELWDGTLWVPYTFAETALPLTATDHLANTAYYTAFYLDGGGTLRFGSFPWDPSDIGVLQGRLVNTVSVSAHSSAGNFTIPPLRGQIVGAFLTTLAGACENSKKKQYVSNAYQVTEYDLYRADPAANWLNSTGTTLILANGGNGLNAVEFFLGFGGRVVEAEVCAYVSNSSDTIATAGVALGLDRIDGDDSTISSAVAVQYRGDVARAFYRGKPGPGYHKLNWLEYGTNSGGLFQTFQGNNPPFKSALSVRLTN